MNLSVKSNLKIPFKLFEDCIPVKGHKRSIIVDLTRSCYYRIPNDLFEILKEFDKNSIQSVMDYYGKHNTNLIKEYFEFLLKNEIVFFTASTNLFPKIDFSRWKYPVTYYQAIIDVDNDFTNINKSVFESLSNLRCQFLQLRFFDSVENSSLKRCLENTNGSTIIGIDIYLKYVSDLQINELTTLLNSYERVNNVYVYGAPVNEKLKSMGQNSICDLYLIQQNVVDCRNCGVVNSDYFAINIQSFTKSLHTNSCLAGKISIDKEGFIKNCPSMSENFGNIKDISLEGAILKKGFKKYWNITKDSISICKDCEYRYICTDCRAYVEDPKDKFSKPLKCGYNPYTGKWGKWSQNPLVKTSISHYNLAETLVTK